MQQMVTYGVGEGVDVLALRRGRRWYECKVLGISVVVSTNENHTERSLVKQPSAREVVVEDVNSQNPVAMSAQNVARLRSEVAKAAPGDHGSRA